MDQIFVCPCGFSMNLENQSKVSTHMSQCNKYLMVSPIGRAFDLQLLHTSYLEQLLMFNADINSWLNRIKFLLVKRGFQVQDQQQLSLDSYSRFTQQIDRRGNIKQHDNTTTNTEITKDLAIWDQKKRVEERNRKIIQKKNVFKLEPDISNNQRRSSDENKMEEYVSSSLNQIEALDLSVSLNCNLEVLCVVCKLNTFSHPCLIINMGCGDKMCQTCFIKLYRSQNSLDCPNLDCKAHISKLFIRQAAVHPGQDFCLICDKEFRSGRNLQRHIINQHLGDTKQFCCNKCTKSMHDYNQLETHKKMHITTKPNQEQFYQEAIEIQHDSITSHKDQID